MNYPLISEYIEAIRSAEENFATLTNLRPVLDEAGNPIMSSGNFAVVFKMKDEQTGKHYAIKCFTKEQEGREDNYSLITEELQKVRSPYFLQVQFLRNELFVDTTQSEESEFSVLLMDWVEGQTLSSFLSSVYNSIRANDEFWTEEEKHIALYELRCLHVNFLRMASWLIKQPFAHGDIKPDNIIIKPDGTFVLIDYDGMFVPSMQGMNKMYMGTPNFRHPFEKKVMLNKNVDNYAISVIALSLYALALVPTLINPNSDNCIFLEEETLNLHGHWVFSEEVLMNNAHFRVLLSIYLYILCINTLSPSYFDECIKEIILPSNYDVFLTKASEEDLKHYWEDDYGVRYSLDGRKVVKASKGLKDIDYTIREGVLTICDQAFQSKNLKSIQLPDSIIAIGDRAFANNDDMEYCNIPSSAKYIFENNPWGGCFNIKKMELNSPFFIIKDGILYSSDYKVLYGLIYWTSPNISVDFRTTKISSNAFWSCRKKYHDFIKKVTMINVLRIGGAAFDGCYSAIFDIKNPIEELGESSFGFCKSLSSLDLSEIKEIPKDAFEYCENLKDVKFSSDLSIINSGAFEGCTSLTVVEIPKKVSFISNDAFSGCTSLISFNIVDDNDNYCSIDGVLYNKSITKLIKYPPGLQSKMFTIPDTICEIADEAFADCTSLELVMCNNKILKFGKKVFEDCESLSKCNIDLDDRTDAQSAWNYGSFLLSFKNADESIKQNGYKLITKAAEMNNPEAQWIIANSFKYGWNGKIKMDDYVLWLKRAADNNHFKAMSTLALEFALGKNTNKDLESSYNLLLTLDKKGLRSTLYCKGDFYYLLGWFFENGKIVSKDVIKAAEYYKKGATWGDSRAEYSLARCYEEGIGLERNLDKAKKYYSKAKEHNHSKAADALQRVEKIASDDLPD